MQRTMNMDNLSVENRIKVRLLENENKEMRNRITELYAALEAQAGKKLKHCDCCRFFVHHYIRNSDGSFCEIASGHCTYGICKSRRKSQTCDFFEFGEFESLF